jgi:anti-anti-sigma factor
MSSGHAQEGRSTSLARIASSDEEQVRVVVVSGELDMSNAEELRDATFHLPNEALGVVLDLSDASFIDSATLGLLFELRGSLARRRQALRVVCAPGSIADRLLELVAFDSDAVEERDRPRAIAAIRREVALRQ